MTTSGISVSGLAPRAVGIASRVSARLSPSYLRRAAETAFDHQMIGIDRLFWDSIGSMGQTHGIDNIRKVLKADWIRSQFDEFLGEEAAFFQNAKAS